MHGGRQSWQWAQVYAEGLLLDTFGGDLGRGAQGDLWKSIVSSSPGRRYQVLNFGSSPWEQITCLTSRYDIYRPPSLSSQVALSAAAVTRRPTTYP